MAFLRFPSLNVAACFCLWGAESGLLSGLAMGWNRPRRTAGERSEPPRSRR